MMGLEDEIIRRYRRESALLWRSITLRPSQPGVDKATRFFNIRWAA